MMEESPVAFIGDADSVLGFRALGAVRPGPAQLLEGERRTPGQVLMDRLERIGEAGLDHGGRKAHAARVLLRRREENGKLAGPQQLFGQAIHQPAGQFHRPLRRAAVGILEQKHLDHGPQVAGLLDQVRHLDPILPAVPESFRQNDDGVVGAPASLHHHRDFPLPGSANFEVTPQFLFQTLAGNRHEGRLEPDIGRVGFEVRPPLRRSGRRECLHDKLSGMAARGGGRFREGCRCGAVPEQQKQNQAADSKLGEEGHPEARAAAGPGELGWSDLAVDRDDHLHAVWMDWWTYGIGYSRNDGTGWSEPVRLPDPAPQGQSCDPRIACDALGRPHVVWEERWGGYWVYYSTLVGDTWTQPVRVDTLPGLRPVLCCDETSRLHVVWRRSGLWHRARAGSGWTEPVFISDTAIAMLPELATSPAGLHLAFRGGWWLFYSADAGAGGISEERAIPAGQRLDVVCLRGGELLLRFDVQERCNAAVSLWDSAGRLAWSCSLGQLEPGHHEGRVSVRQLPSGIYVCRLEAGGRPSAAKTVVLK